MGNVIGHTDFFEYRKPVNPEYLMQDDDPNWLLYTMRLNGTRRVLRHHPTEKRCLFLTPTGCRFDVETRPLICRMYPFDYTERGIHGVASECPQHLLQPGQDILSALGMSYEEAIPWWSMLYRELRQEWEETYSPNVFETSRFVLSPQRLQQTACVLG